MRIWSIHPKYLDSKGLVALWRESLLAKEVLKGKTKGWKKHPQLNRFKLHKNPVRAINTYLFHVWKESKKRGYNFNKNKIEKFFTNKRIEITREQIMIEFEQLKSKLKKRDPEKYKDILKIKDPETNPVFIITTTLKSF